MNNKAGTRERETELTRRKQRRKSMHADEKRAARRVFISSISFFLLPYMSSPVYFRLATLMPTSCANNGARAVICATNIDIVLNGALVQLLNYGRVRLVRTFKKRRFRSAKAAAHTSALCIGRMRIHSRDNKRSLALSGVLVLSIIVRERLL